ncbi:unnamed protein product [Adineta steineri]|uniref:Nuclease HARBI1 n=1 Tax=Adineta steineri TaxID=433720 RepID=A0A815A8W7_9BILA|nr:unnamed protein product [Adineta steineri]CAF1486413.1 unnamed protein product [Adineta steineri]
MSENIFKYNFRIKWSTFMELADEIGPYLYKNETYLRQAIPVHKRTACTLYLLGSTSELRTVGNFFGVGKTIAAAILHEFCNILADTCFHRFIKFPTTDDEIKDTTDEFLIKSGYPMCIRCLDGTYISIQPPSGEECDYYNYRNTT